MRHELILEGKPYPGDTGTVYFGRCLCNGWGTGKDSTEKSVRDRWQQHVDAKLFKADVAKILGWSDGNHVSVARLRTRAGTAIVPFPDPDGTHPWVNGRELPTWRRSTIERYQADIQAAGGRARPVTHEMVERMRRLRDIDHLSYEEIGAKLGVGKTTVHRHLTTTAEESSK